MSSDQTNFNTDDLSDTYIEYLQYLLGDGPMPDETDPELTVFDDSDAESNNSWDDILASEQIRDLELD